MKILLLGASGLVGGAFARTGAGAGHVITGTTGTWHGPIAGVAHRVGVDLMDAGALDRLLQASGAELIVNAAAVADPGACDTDPPRSQRLNAALPVQLAAWSRQMGARLIHLSSEQVFDGRSAAPYAVRDPVHAINLYARQKIEAETGVLQADPRAVILRLPLLLGNSPSGRRSVHERLLEMWAAGREARLFVDEIRQPCTADSVARALTEIADRPGLNGIFHWAGTDPASRFELGRKIRERFGLSEAQARLVPVERKGDPKALAARPANLTLNLEPLATQLPTKPQTLDGALGELQTPAWWRAV